VAIDDTLLPKRGRKVHGASWHRDPLGPRFRVNLIHAQRMLQASVLVPDGQRPCRSRGVPVRLVACPAARKPGRKDDEMTREHRRQEARQKKLTQQGAECIASLRHDLDLEDEAGRTLITCVDGSYTNRQVFGNIPHDTILIGRIRKDAKLFALPENPVTKGRRKCYGAQLPTPEEIRQSEDYQWEDVEAFSTGKVHTYQAKTVAPVRWKPAGGKRDLRLVVIRRKCYRTREGGPNNQKDPIYLICSDCSLSLEQIVQSYFWRWEIEQNFRDEKTILGVGEAQVRTQDAAELVPEFLVAVYALLQLAAIEAEKCGGLDQLEIPKWRKSKPPSRTSAQQLINLLRKELMAEAMADETFSGFMPATPGKARRREVQNPFRNAAFHQQK
jgi:hypothetical protein